MPSGADMVYAERRVICERAQPLEQNIANIRASFRRNLPRFHELREVGKRNDEPLAIIAGGPSLEARQGELVGFRNTMTCGSACALIGIPRYAVLNDPRASNVRYLQTKNKYTRYLVASHCAPEIFDWLDGCSVAVWHTNGEAPEEEFRGEPSVGWGGTTTLRAISLAIILGYHDLHFFGLDCSYDGNAQHAYDGPRDPDIEVAYVERPGREPRGFLTKAALIAQAQEFMVIVAHHHDKFRATIHGDGLLAETVRSGDPELQEFVRLC